MQRPLILANQGLGRFSEDIVNIRLRQNLIQPRSGKAELKASHQAAQFTFDQVNNRALSALKRGSYPIIPLGALRARGRTGGIGLHKIAHSGSGHQIPYS